MIRKLLARVREYRRETIQTPLFMIGEVAMEVLIPMIMKWMIDRGIEGNDGAGSMANIWLYGGLLLVAAMISLASGVIAGRMAAVASAGFARNLRHDMFARIQTFAFENIDKFSSASPVTRLTVLFLTENAIL